MGRAGPLSRDCADTYAGIAGLLFHLYYVRTEGLQATPATLSLLSAEESARYRRFIPPEKRLEYLVTRVLVRTVLSAALGTPPGDLRFSCNEWGRPEVDPPTELSFNISHTPGLVVCAVRQGHTLGVDTELFSRAPALLELAPQVFSRQEQADLFALPREERAHRAVVLWTLKESYIKARGRGLAIALDLFSFHFSPGHIGIEVAPGLDDQGDRWEFRLVVLGPHLVAVAADCGNSVAMSVNVTELHLSAFGAGEPPFPD